MSSGIQRVLAVTFALGIAIAVTPAAGATPGTTTTPAAAKLKVKLEVTNKGKYTAAICGLDWLGGYCTYSVKPGKTADFTVEPRNAEDPFEIRVVVNKGGSEYFHTATGEAKACFVTGGTAKNPTVEEVDCA